MSAKLTMRVDIPQYVPFSCKKIGGLRLDAAAPGRASERVGHRRVRTEEEYAGAHDVLWAEGGYVGGGTQHRVRIYGLVQSVYLYAPHPARRRSQAPGRCLRGACAALGPTTGGSGSAARTAGPRQPNWPGYSKCCGREARRQKSRARRRAGSRAMGIERRERRACHARAAQSARTMAARPGSRCTTRAAERKSPRLAITRAVPFSCVRTAISVSKPSWSSNSSVVFPPAWRDSVGGAVRQSEGAVSSRPCPLGPRATPQPRPPRLSTSRSGFEYARTNQGADGGALAPRTALRAGVRRAPSPGFH